jgi:uncharacterized membrane protein HdeD (DUF308 family)
MDKINTNIYKDKWWQFGIVIVILGLILSTSLPLIFLSFELIMGILLIVVGIIMIYKIFEVKPNDTT